MGIEQVRNGGGGERRRPGLRRLRVAGFRSSREHRPERVRPLQGDGDMETGDCMCGKESRLVLSHRFSPWIWQLNNRKGHNRHRRGQRLHEWGEAS